MTANADTEAAGGQPARSEDREWAEAFQAASRAAEGWFNTVALIAHFGRGGDVDNAFSLLLPSPGTAGASLQDAYSEHRQAIEAMQDRLAVVSDGEINWGDRGLRAVARVPNAVYPHVWSSAHEASAGLARLALDLLATPLAGVTEPAAQWERAERLLAARWEALEFPRTEVAALQERIRRERAKILVTSELAAMPPSSAIRQRQPQERLTIDLQARTVTLDGTPYRVSSERALRWVRILVARSPQWVSSAELNEIDPKLTCTRTDRYKKLLPEPISSLIVSETGAGSHILLPPK